MPQHGERHCVRQRVQPVTIPIPVSSRDTKTQTQSASGRDSRLRLTAVCLFALAIRLVVMFAGHTYLVKDDDTNHFGFGWEMGRVACSLAQGRGFSSPLPLPTGPTAIVGPIYPLILALVFKFFGIYSTSSAIAIRFLQCVFSSLTCLFIYLCARNTVGRRAGMLAAVVWALFPLNIFFAVQRVWETTLTAMLVAALFWAMNSVRESPSASRGAFAGALLGIAALLSTSLVVLAVPFAISAIVKNRLRLLRAAVAGSLALLVVVSPWLIRNRTQFGAIMFRSNFPLEFRVGNNIESYGQKMENLHPSNTPALNRHWQQIGEARFMEEERQANARFLAEHSDRFWFATANRIANYWTGAWIRPMADYPNDWRVIVPTSLLTLLGFVGLCLMFSRGQSQAWMYLGCLTVYPAAYYLTTSQPRFYHAMSPLLVLAASFAVCRVIDFLQSTSKNSGLPKETALFKESEG